MDRAKIVLCRLFRNGYTLVWDVTNGFACMLYFELLEDISRMDLAAGSK